MAIRVATPHIGGPIPLGSSEFAAALAEPPPQPGDPGVLLLRNKQPGATQPGPSGVPQAAAGAVRCAVRAHEHRWQDHGDVDGQRRVPSGPRRPSSLPGADGGMRARLWARHEHRARFPRSPGDLRDGAFIPKFREVTKFARSIFPPATSSPAPPSPHALPPLTADTPSFASTPWTTIRPSENVSLNLTRSLNLSPRPPAAGIPDSPDPRSVAHFLDHDPAAASVTSPPLQPPRGSRSPPRVDQI